MSFKRAIRWMLIGQIILQIPDSKDADVIAARDSYNARTGQTLTTQQFVKETLKRGVAAELTNIQTQKAQATISTGKATCEAEAASKQAAVEQYLQDQLGGW